LDTQPVDRLVSSSALAYTEQVFFAIVDFSLNRQAMVIDVLVKVTVVALQSR
jgi:hypothetical protein